MSNISFKKVMRDCIGNRQIKSGERHGKLFYDYQVIDENKHVATFMTCSHKRGYHLYDLDSQLIRDPSSVNRMHQIVYAESQAKFGKVYEIAKHNGAIPTDEQLEERRAKERADRLAKAEKDRLDAIKYHKREAAEDMYDLLLELRNGSFLTAVHYMKACRTLSKAEGVHLVEVNAEFT